MAKYDNEDCYNGLAPDSVTAAGLLSSAQFTNGLPHTQQPFHEDKWGAFTYCRRLHAKIVSTSAYASQTQPGTSICYRRLPPEAIWNSGVLRTSCAPPDGKCWGVHNSSNLSAMGTKKDLFITNYIESIFEDGVQLKDMAMLRKIF